MTHFQTHCHGRGHDSPGGLILAMECLRCFRRSGLPESQFVKYAPPPTQTPCPQRIAEKEQA